MAKTDTADELFVRNVSLHDAIASVGQAGIIFVAAAGNSAGNNDADPLYPASYDLDNILAVAATTRADREIYE